VLLLADDAPLARALVAVSAHARAQGAPLAIAPGWLPGLLAIGAIGDADPLDEALDPAIDRAAFAEALASANVPRAATPVLASAVASRDDVIELRALGGVREPTRPLTPFEHRALLDVVGAELGAHLRVDRVRVERGAANRDDPRTLNHCTTDAAGRSTIRLRSDNGVTLGARTHALVHELGHALIGHARAAGRPYRAAYGSSDYGEFLAPSTAARVCDEEALVRAIADAWLLRRNTTWARTWPGAIDAVGQHLDADDLAAFARFRLAQGLGLPATPAWVRRIG
jgi:hypothetical protein